jgi:hypothetical protein
MIKVILFMSLLFPKYKLTEKEQYIKNIIEKLLEHPNTTKLMDPITLHYYLDNRTLGYFVLVNDELIKITNHKFYYTENFSSLFGRELEKVIGIAISRDRKRVEEEMFKNESNLLGNIMDKILTSK